MKLWLERAKNKFGSVRISGAPARRFSAMFALGAVCLAAQAAVAQPVAAPAQSSSFVTAAYLSVLGLIPFLLVIVTSFSKFSVVFSVLRSALGTQNVPPNVVLNSLAIVLSMVVMAPVMRPTSERLGPYLSAGTEQLSSLSQIETAAHDVAEPLRIFLVANSGARELALFERLAGREVPSDQAAIPISSAIPAFAVTELAEAFLIGFLIFIPFIVLDLFIGSVLMSLGMHMMSPTSVSMPFKLLLFVLVNGWMVLSESLILSYLHPPYSP